MISAYDRDELKLPLSPEDLIRTLDRGVLPEIYNAIHYTLSDSAKLNEYGYAETSSHLRAIKIWSLASDWGSLVTNDNSPKQVVMGLVLHRLTGSKEAIDVLHKLNHVSSYRDIRLQNMAWATMTSTKTSLFDSLRKGVVTHSTMDNNDGRQETVTGSGTTHDTNKTIFQLPTEEDLAIPLISSDIERPLDICSDDELVPGLAPSYQIGKLVGPPLVESHVDDNCREALDLCLERDIEWSLAGLLPSEILGKELPLLGSWTAFNKMVSSKEISACVQEYIPVSPAPPEYPICKEYLDFLLDLIESLEIPYVIAHSDEAVYSKLCHLLWKNPDLYKNIFLMMGGFHQLRLRQKLLYKRYSCRGYKEWWVESGVIAAGSADQAFEGRNYYRCMRLHKECFDALMQHRIMEVTCSHTNMDSDLMAAVQMLRKDPNAMTLNAVIDSKPFKSLVAQLLHCLPNTEGAMTICYLKDISSLLAMISAVRECDLERHLQSERDMLKLTFALDQI